MAKWSLPVLLEGLHKDIEHRLSFSRGGFGHTVAMGDATEGVWLEMLNKYLPLRYHADKAFVVDSDGNFSEQMDIVVYDRQYTPFILTHEGQKIIPAEGVYAVFECKQELGAGEVSYAREKVLSVRKLNRTSLPIPHAGGTYAPKKPAHILGGILTFESSWTPAFGEPLKKALALSDKDDGLEMGCVAAKGHFCTNLEGEGYTFVSEGRPATAFLFELIARLQSMATAPMIDIRAYSRWLAPTDESTPAKVA